MGILSRFDMSTDFTQFFLVAAFLTLLFTVLLSWVAPGNKEKRKLRGKVDDRFAQTDGELID